MRRDDSDVMMSNELSNERVVQCERCEVGGRLAFELFVRIQKLS